MSNFTWRTLNDHLPDMTEQQVLDELTAERAGKGRTVILVRLHQRYTMLRAERERSEILAEARGPQEAV